MGRWAAWVVAVGCLVAAPADAGKKKKGKDDTPPGADVAPDAVGVRQAELLEAAGLPDPGGVEITSDASGLPKIELPCGYTQGETQRYALLKHTSQILPGQGQRALGASSSELALTVHGWKNNRAEVELRYVSAELTSKDDDPISRAITERLSNVLVNQPVRLEVDHSKGQISLVNVDAVTAMFKTAMDETIEILKSEGEGLPEEALSVLDELVADPRMVEASVLEDLRPLFDYTCGPFPVGTVNYRAPMENPLGGAPMAGNGHVSLSQPDPATATFEATESLDPEQLEAALAPMMPPDMPVDVAALGVASTRSLTVTVDAMGGWVQSWRHERTVGAMGTTHHEVAEMTRLP